jgi:Flp pilus assembly protein TadG
VKQSIPSPRILRSLTRRSAVLDIRKREDGSTLVEFALVASLLFTIVLGIMQMCIALFTYDLVCESARQGTRYAMVRGNTCLVSGASCTATAAQIQTYVRNLGYPGILPANMAVDTTYSSFPTGSTCTPNTNCANPGNQVVVSVTYTLPLRIPFIPSRTLSLVSTSARIISQ